MLLWHSFRSPSSLTQPRRPNASRDRPRQRRLRRPILFYFCTVCEQGLWDRTDGSYLRRPEGGTYSSVGSLFKRSSLRLTNRNTASGNKIAAHVLLHVHTQSGCCYLHIILTSSSFSSNARSLSVITFWTGRVLRKRKIHISQEPQCTCW